MAKKRTERKAKSFGEAIGLQYIFNNTITDFFLGLALIGIAIVTIIAMVSFLNTGYADQSILENLKAGEWTNTEQQFQNYCGSLGAIISYWLIAVNFGFPAFLLPCYIIMAGLQLMNAYKVNLWKWFFCLMIVMIWSSVTFAKFLTPIMGGLIFNPGGKHGLFVVQNLENVVGPPGLTAILLFVAIAFLTYLTSETITIIRKALNPIGYISNKVKFEITNHDNKAETNAIDEAYAHAAKGQTEEQPEEQEEYKDDEQPTVIDLDVAPDKTFSEPVSQENGQAQTDETADAADSQENAAEEQTDAETAGKPLSFLEQQRQLRAARAKQEDEEMKAAAASEALNMDISVAASDEKASGNTVSSAEVLNTPINPKEPFTRYKYPTLNLLKKYEDDGVSIDEEEQRANKNRIIEVLGNFGVQIKTIRATVGPTITLYEIQPAEGVRISKIKNLEDDIALSLAALGIRIIAPIPGKGTIGIEVPNANPKIVSMESTLNSKKFQETKMELPIALGKTITNEVFMVDLAKIPHLLVAGATGQGKSVGLNAIITSLLYKKHPNELKLVLIDPKKVEFSVYSRITNKFMAALADEDEPIITDVTKVVRTLNSLCVLMDSRYDLLKKAGARNIKEYNQKYINHKLRLTDGHEYMPYIVVIIDEFGDLIMTAGKEVELPIARIAQLARAVGIHMIIATQRPTTSIITGNIKANFPGRVAFKVTSAIDSKTILDRTGANQLIGRGDMLYLNGQEPVRVQCAFVDTPEIERINEFIQEQPGPIEPMELPEPANNEGGASGGGTVDAKNLDPFFEEAAHAIVLSQQGSTSMIQRRFSIGYNRAGRLMDQMEEAGIVGAAQGSKPREVLIQDENQLNNLLLQLRNS
ncbi:DNA translocase FtsK [Prevotella copri]|uniref:FtsK/SpoIIIE family DNA translocase n=1 Tax=Segatella copri TaxID=165179 RepID=UPI00222E534E|nr:DNA translocase FtsK [Segatella copri]MCW4117649.1 DNA translocase FtsK [Segatella copri]